MNPHPSSHESGSVGPRKTRREFVKRSLLACASATVAKDLAAASAGAASAGATSAASGPAGQGAGARVPPDPVTPYGLGPPIYLADLDRCQPASVLATKWRPNRWKVLPFEAAQVKGVMLTAGQNTAVPDVEYSLPQKGWHAIHFGLMSKYWESRLQVRLKRDRVFSLLTHHNMADAKVNRRDIEYSAHGHTTTHFDEMFWKYVRLEGNDALVFRQLQVQVAPGDPRAVGNRFMPCWLGYVKLVPLTDEEVRALTADRERRDTRRLFATNDAFGSLSWLHFTAADDIRREIEPYRDTDFSRMYWEAGMGDVTYFPSKVGSLLTFEWMEDHYRTQDRIVGQTYADFRAKGVDPFRVALDYCHEVGLEFHAAYRVAGFYFPAPEDEWNSGGLYHRHPEWRGRDRQGRPTPRLSYAFPGVREFVLGLLRELAGYPLDGVCLLYNRRLPVLEYEAPLIDSFKARHGVDPRTLAESDPRWLAHKAGVLTDFMRALQALLREESRRQNRARPLPVTVVVVSSEQENYSYGLDLKTWVAEGLIDTLVPYSSEAGINSNLTSWEDPRAAEYFIRLTRGTSCKLALNLMPRQITPEDYKRRAHALYEAGVDHLYFWDTHHRNFFDRSWSTLSRLGHKDELVDWAARGRPPVARPEVKLSKIADWDLSYGTPG
ncbi:MAG: hypothetical protein HY736_20840 [Verrucomicrobia bacterium]|nr:hypothetical protein [Verrucomicrobiota bacterium]